MLNDIKRGQIYFADLGGSFGREQDGTRPVLILQNDKGNEFSPTTIVATITSSSLEDSVTIYRGVTSYNDKDLKALSWTLDYNKAKWFANRFNENGKVYEAQIDKAHIFAFFNRRGESEVVVNPKYLMGITELEEPINELVPRISENEMRM